MTPLQRLVTSLDFYTIFTARMIYRLQITPQKVVFICCFLWSRWLLVPPRTLEV